MALRCIWMTCRCWSYEQLPMSQRLNNCKLLPSWHLLRKNLKAKLFMFLSHEMKNRFASKWLTLQKQFFHWIWRIYWNDLAAALFDDNNFCPPINTKWMMKRVTMKWAKCSLSLTRAQALKIHPELVYLCVKLFWQAWCLISLSPSLFWCSI